MWKSGRDLGDAFEIERTIESIEKHVFILMETPLHLVQMENIDP